MRRNHTPVNFFPLFRVFQRNYSFMYLLNWFPHSFCCHFKLIVLERSSGLSARILTSFVYLSLLFSDALYAGEVICATSLANYWLRSPNFYSDISYKLLYSCYNNHHLHRHVAGGKVLPVEHDCRECSRCGRYLRYVVWSTVFVC